jgi:hypothetical protein
MRQLSSLGLPLASRRGTWLAFAGLITFYLLTMARDLSFYDSAEFATVAQQGGLSHPPGHPLYTLLAWLFAHLPGATPLLGLNLLSTLAGALCLFPLVSIAQTLVPSQGHRWLPFGIALTLGHPVAWEGATRIEVYSLATFLALWALARLAGAWQQGRWWIPGLALGLAASVNPITALCLGLASLPTLVQGLRQSSSILIWRQMASGLGGALLGLVPYGYIFLVAHRLDVFVWGAPTGGDALWHYVTLADFRPNLQAASADIVSNGWKWLYWAGETGTLPLCGLGLVAHLLWSHGAPGNGPTGNGGIGRPTATLCLAFTLYYLWRNVTFFPEVTDYSGYLALPWTLLAAGTVAGVIRLLLLPDGLRLLRALVPLALVANVVWSPPALWERSRHRDTLARTVCSDLLAQAPRQSVLIMGSDHWVFPLIYLQQVEGLRPDVVLMPTGLAGSSWYWAQLYRQHPNLRSIALRGPGAKRGRIRRFLAAHPQRPVLYEDWTLASWAGQPGCPGPWLVWDRRSCPSTTEGTAPPLLDRSTSVLERQLASLGQGSPPAAAVIAAISLDRGEVLWRLGYGEAAFRALQAGIPRSERPTLPSQPDWDRVGPLRRPPVAWPLTHAIGHYSRNLFFAGQLLSHAGAPTVAANYLRRAVEAGLPAPGSP